MEYKNKLISLLQQLNLEIDDSQADKFLHYMDYVLDWNTKINLTSITDKDEFIVKHFADSVSLLSVMQVKKNSNIIDIGSGAGFPGLPIKILRPDINLTLVDSLLKRINFLELVKNELALENIKCVHARAEDFIKHHRQEYDFCISRAVANLQVLSEICLPFVKIGGFFVAYKGINAEEEVKKAQNSIKILGAQVADIKKINLLGLSHYLIFVRKLSHSPLKYPRVYAKILKSPL